MPTPQSSERRQMIVLVDSDDNYYEFPREVLERAKVSDARKDQIKQALEDVLEESGYINAPVIPGSIVDTPWAKSNAIRYAGFYLAPGEESAN